MKYQNMKMSIASHSQKLFSLINCIVFGVLPWIFGSCASNFNLSMDRRFRWMATMMVKSFNEKWQTQCETEWRTLIWKLHYKRIANFHICFLQKSFSSWYLNDDKQTKCYCPKKVVEIGKNNTIKIAEVF